MHISLVSAQLAPTPFPQGVQSRPESVRSGDLVRFRVRLMDMGNSAPVTHSHVST